MPLHALVLIDLILTSPSSGPMVTILSLVMYQVHNGSNGHSDGKALCCRDTAAELLSTAGRWKMKGRASTKGRQGRRRRDAKKQLAAIPEVLDVFVQLPSGEKVRMP